MSIERPTVNNDPGPTNVDEPDPGPNEESIHNPPSDPDDDDVLEDEEGIANAP
jgi:hypothetical protein